MKCRHLATACILATACTTVHSAPPPAPAGNSWRLTFEDTFDGKALDSAKWVVRGDQPRKGGWWTKSACAPDDQGKLIIRTAREGEKWISGCVETKGKFEQKFGYWECRARIPKSPGHWAAFWLTCDGVGKIGDDGRDGSEIDIMEIPKRDGTVNYAIHWDGYGKDHKVIGGASKFPEILDDWATYAVLWTPEIYVFYVNGKETWRTTAGGVCQVPVHLKLSTEIGTWAGELDASKLPDQFLIDHVRVYDLGGGWSVPLQIPSARP